MGSPRTPRICPGVGTLARLVATAAVGCLPDHALPPAAQIACSGDGACPEGTLCKPALGRCVPAGNADQEPPSLAEPPEIRPESGTVGTVFSLELLVGEPLGRDPELRIELGERVARPELDESRTRRADLYYAYTYAATGAEPQGSVQVVADLLDAAGNLSPAVALGSIRFDFGAPRLGGAQLSHTQATVGTELRLDLTFEEPLAEAPEVRMLAGSDPEQERPWSEESGDGQRFAFSYVPGGEEPEGVHTVRLAGGRDAAGNPLEAQEVGEVRLDFVPPELVDARCDPRLAAPGDVVRVTVTVSEPPPAPPVVTATGAGGDVVELLAAGGADGVLSFRHVVLAGEGGRYDLALTGVRDAAGNEAPPFSLGELVLDESPPELATFRLSRPGREGGEVFSAADTLEVGLSPDEALGSEPRVRLGAVPVACEARAEDDSEPFVCRLALAGTGLAGTFPLAVELADRVGNRQTVDAARVAVDALPPSLGGAAVSPALVPLGGTAVLSVLAGEALAAPPELVWGAGEVPPGFAPPEVTARTWSWRLTVDAQTPPGEHRLRSVSLTDVAGNRADHELAEGAVVLRVDNAPPVIDGVVTDAEVYSRQEGFSRVRVTVAAPAPLDAAGARLEAWFGEARLACAGHESPPGRHVCEHLVGADDRPGAVLVRVTAEDAAGNTTRAGTTVRLDLSPPALVAGSASRQLVPAPDSPLAEVAVAGVGTTVRLGFNVDEPLLEDPAVVSVRNGLVFEPVVRAGAYYLFAHTLEAGDLVEGVETLAVSLRDRVGNPAAVELDAAELQLVVDGSAPPAPAVDEPGRIVFVRKPWGDAEEPERVVQRVLGSAGATEGGGTVLVYDSAAAGRTELGRVAAGADGAFAPVELQPPDRPEVWVGHADAAGNLSPVVRVRDMDWLATLGFKRAGETVDNPHTFANLSIWRDALCADEACLAHEVGAEPLVRIGDGVVNRNRGGLAWRKESAGRRSTPTELGREAPGLAFDSSRGRLVLFGGGQMGDTWEWDGRDWHRLEPDHSPPPRTLHAMVYDRARGLVVMFGGWGPGGRLDDLWEWDGRDWHGAEPGRSPPARAGHALAYDLARRQVVLFGGGDGNDEHDDTWTWDGAEWQERQPDRSPAGRSEHALVFDTARDRVVLFGGWGRDGCLADTWEWDGQEWHPAEPESSPPGRRRHALAWDSARGRAVLFGGMSADGALADTWEWDGQEWHPMQTEVSPPPLSLHAMAYDSLRGEALVVGGGLGEFSADGWSGDLWGWDGRRWERAGPVAVPAARRGHAMAWDGVRGRVVAFGGNAGGLVRRDTLEWSGRGWLPLDVGTAPPGGLDAALAHDAARNEVVLFGGRDDDAFDETWVWDGAEWRQREVADRPPARHRHALAYDEERQRTVLFGGATDVLQDDWDWEQLGDTWEWDGERWHRLVPEHSPPARYGHALAWAEGEVLLFGGYAGEYLDDTWAWDGEDWQQLSPEHVPGPRAGHVMARNAARGRVALVGGECDEGTWNSTWEWDGQDWQLRQVDPPPSRHGAALAYDSGRRRLVLSGGVLPSSDDPLLDTWEFDGSAWHAAGGDRGPPGRRLGVLGYDDSRRQVVLFGGHDGDRLGNDTWLWDGRTWQEALPFVRLMRRRSHAMVWHELRERLYLFGGMGGPEGQPSHATDDCGEWDGSVWQTSCYGDRPPERFEHGLAYDAGRERLVLFGGVDADGRALADTWERDDLAWRRLHPEPSPPARSGPALQYDEARQRVVLFGGTDADHHVLGDTWEWDGVAWRRLDPEESPPARSGHAVVFDATRGLVLLFGGEDDDGAPLRDTWEWDGVTWRRLELELAPPARSGHMMAYDGDRAGTVLFGGVDAQAEVLDDTWTLPSGSDGRPGQRLVVDLGSAGCAAGCVPTSVTAAFHSAGRGVLDGEPVSGVRLLAWSAALGRWQVLASNDGGDLPEPVRWTAGEPAEVSALLFRGDLHFAVTPLGGNGPGRAELATDYAEASVRLRLP